MHLIRHNQSLKMSFTVSKSCILREDADDGWCLGYVMTILLLKQRLIMMVSAADAERELVINEYLLQPMPVQWRVRKQDRADRRVEQ